MADELPMATPWQPQRTEAARNQERLLATTRELLRDRDAGTVDVREIAAAAGVGVGTLYRRFGGKAGLLSAVVGVHERELQDAIIGGPPPLGPGAAPLDRLVAFLQALARLTEENLNVLLATDATPPGRRRIGAYQAWRLHIEHLLDPALDAHDRRWRADLLLAPLDPGLYAEHRRVAGLSAERIERRLAALATSVAESAM
jgi:AcrR family transcriptional regulator